ncbi:unnamed protein product, partial [Pylaiella littoralis]
MWVESKCSQPVFNIFRSISFIFERSKLVVAHLLRLLMRVLQQHCVQTHRRTCVLTEPLHLTFSLGHLLPPNSGRPEFASCLKLNVRPLLLHSTPPIGQFRLAP